MFAILKLQRETCLQMENITKRNIPYEEVPGED